ncbi:unnamed protein product [Rotaria sp. Silwood1]|nr:unnamed protein product [Rotaria sp. Silwood1]
MEDEQQAELIEECNVLRRELNDLMTNDFDRVLTEITDILKTLIRSLKRPDESTDITSSDSTAKPIVLSLTHPQNSEILKCTVTLLGSDITTADVVYKAGTKVQPPMNNAFRTTIATQQMKYWSLQQLHECTQHLERALRCVVLTDFDRNIEQLYKAIQYLDLIIDCINNARDNILLPKKKRIDDLRRNKNTTIFQPPIPENMAFSFYVQGSKLSFAVYHTSVQGKSSGYFKHFIEANVPTLADLVNQLSYILLQLQQLRDKLRIFDEYQNGADWNTNKYLLYRCSLSTDRCETISAALKQFYLKVHPDLFSQYPKEKDVNEKSLQLVSAYLSGLQRKEYMASISVKFFTKSLSNLPSPAPVSFNSHRVTLNSNDLLTSVNSLLTALNLPIVERPKEQKNVGRHEIQFKIIEIEKFYDFTKIPKISIKTWLANNIEAARVIAKRHQELLNEINDKVNSITERFKLKSIEYSDDWSVPQFSTCLRTLLMYADKWHEKLLTLQGKRLIFGNKSCLLQDGSLELSANDPPIYWDNVICCELLDSNKYMEKIASYENNLSQYFRGITIRQDPDSESLCRAHTYLYHLIQLSSHLNLNRHHEAHKKISWANFYLFINPYSSEPSLTNSGFFQINAFDATMDILEFMIDNRKQAEKTRNLYEKDVVKERNLLEIIQKQFNLTDILINRRLKKRDINQCCQRLLDERQHFLNILTKCRLKIDKNYNLAQNGTISIPWDWSFASNETL